MSRFVVLLVAAVVLVAGAHAMGGDQVADPLFPQFLSWMKQFNKTYSSEETFHMRFAVWQTNFFKAKDLRRQQEEATGESAEGVFGMSKFADQTPEEFSRLLGYKPSQRPRTNIRVQNPPLFAAADKVDWREKHAVTPVKNQGQCGSCWAFSATEELESMWILSGHDMLELSVQQIVSCDKVDAGCDGGDTITAYEYIQKAGGLVPNKDYPYHSGNGNTGNCKVNISEAKVTTHHHWYATPPCNSGACHNQDEDKLAKNLAATGPVSICVNANDAWQMYTGGVLRSGCSGAADDLDHCVQLVGYNKQASPAYWIVRNSWAADWGEAGYIYIEMGKNLCGVADEATFVNVTRV